MKKEFKLPDIEVIRLENTNDIVTASFGAILAGETTATVPWKNN